MDTNRDDVRAIEAATDLLVRGLNRGDISSITDLVTETTMLLPPARRTSKGQRAVDALRNLAMANEGIAMMSTDMEPLAEGFVRDVGSLSLRLKESGERRMSRYSVLWQKVGTAWTIATLTWNREASPGGRGRQGGEGGGGQGGGGQGEM